MAGRPDPRSHDLKHIGGAADATALLAVNVVLLALMKDIAGVQT
jgi:hypothetical protein